MDGILIIDKPAGITSHDVVSRVRRIIGTRRVGHTGTLDPFATGVMVVLVGRATRLARFLEKDSKTYQALIKFGERTETGDKTGKVTATAGITTKQLSEKIAAENFDAIFDQFRGEIMQTPPMYSAKKKEGKKLYELARKGVEIERSAVPVTIYKLKALFREGATLRIAVECSAGTYIRTLAEDIGEAAGTFAHLTELRRTAAGNFDILRAITIEQLAALEQHAPYLIGMNEAVGHLAEFKLNEDRFAKTLSGLSTRVTGDKFSDGQAVRMTDPKGELAAVGIYDAAENMLRPKVVLG